MVSLGAFINTLPQWLSEPYLVEHTFDNRTSYGIVCQMGELSCQSSKNESKLFYWILVGEVIMGLGFSGFMTLGMSYLQDASLPNNRAYNQGVFWTIFFTGPLISFGGIFPYVTRKYVDFYRGSTNMDRHDPEWVGAWWLGYLIMGSLLFVVSLFIFTFPRTPPNAEYSEKQAELHIDEVLPTLKRLVYPTTALAAIPLTLVMCNAFASASISVLTTWAGKFLERQYGLAANKAGAYYGTVTVVSAMLGAFLGGWYHRRHKIRSVYFKDQLILEFFS